MLEQVNKINFKEKIKNSYRKKLYEFFILVENSNWVRINKKNKRK